MVSLWLIASPWVARFAMAVTFDRAFKEEMRLLAARPARRNSRRNVGQNDSVYLWAFDTLMRTCLARTTTSPRPQGKGLSGSVMEWEVLFCHGDGAHFSWENKHREAAIPGEWFRFKERRELAFLLFVSFEIFVIIHWISTSPLLVRAQNLQAGLHPRIIHPQTSLRTSIKQLQLKQLIY